MIKNWASIDPGQSTGITIWGSDGKHVVTSTMKYITAKEYIDRLEKMKAHHSISFAIIEDYNQFAGKKYFNAFKVNTQAQLCREVFEDHIRINTSQWNPGSLKDETKKMIILQDFHLSFKNSDEADSFLIGANIWKRVQIQSGDAYNALFALATSGTKKFPRASDKLPWIELLENQKVCTITGSGITFNMIVPEKEIKKTAQDIWNYPNKYSNFFIINDSDSVYSKFLKYLWIKFPDEHEEQLTSFVND